MGTRWVGGQGRVGGVRGARGAAGSAGARAWDSLACGGMMCGAKGATIKGRAVRACMHGRVTAAAAGAAALSSVTVCVRVRRCVCAVDLVLLVGGGAVFAYLLCGLCWRGGRTDGEWWRWDGVGGGGHVTVRVGWCVARCAAASWAVSSFVGCGVSWLRGADDVARGWR